MLPVFRTFVLHVFTVHVVQKIRFATRHHRLHFHDWREKWQMHADAACISGHKAPRARGARVGRFEDKLRPHCALALSMHRGESGVKESNTNQPHTLPPSAGEQRERRSHRQRKGGTSNIERTRGARMRNGCRCERRWVGQARSASIQSTCTDSAGEQQDAPPDATAPRDGARARRT
jgi:hypothetical protein